MEDIKFDILEYLGKLSDAVFVSISINYKEKYYDATFCYRKETLIIAVNPELEKVWGCRVEDWVGYHQLLLAIMRKCVPYDQIINQIGEFDNSRFKIIYPE